MRRFMDLVCNDPASAWFMIFTVLVAIVIVVGMVCDTIVQVAG